MAIGNLCNHVKATRMCKIDRSPWKGEAPGRFCGPGVCLTWGSLYHRNLEQDLSMLGGMCGDLHLGDKAQDPTGPATGDFGASALPYHEYPRS